jgi:hypothetical protein
VDGDAFSFTRYPNLAFLDNEYASLPYNIARKVTKTSLFLALVDFSPPKPYPKRQFQKRKLTVGLAVSVRIGVSVRVFVTAPFNEMRNRV